VYDRAVIAVNTLASGVLRRGASVVRTKHEEEEEDREEGEDGTAARVTFSDTDEIKLLSPLEAPSQTPTPSIPNSGASTPNSHSDDSLVNGNINSPIAKIVASRLSFWSRLSKRNSGDGEGSVCDSTDVDHPSLDELNPMSASSFSPNPPHPTSTPIVSQTPKPNLTSPSEMLSTIINTTAPPPPTAEERKSQLEDKIVRETVKEFTKGGMYFAYNFGESLRSFVKKEGN
jgi:phosphatidylinositol 4-phosphatase